MLYSIYSYIRDGVAAAVVVVEILPILAFTKLSRPLAIGTPPRWPIVPILSVCRQIRSRLLLARTVPLWPLNGKREILLVLAYLSHAGQLNVLVSTW